MFYFKKQFSIKHLVIKDEFYVIYIKFNNRNSINIHVFTSLQRKWHSTKLSKGEHWNSQRTGARSFAHGTNSIL